MRLAKRAVTTFVVARITRSEIRDRLSIEMPLPDCAARNPGYERVHKSAAVPP